MPDYPGWNLDLRFWNHDSELSYPVGVHHSRGGQTMLTRREVAMMWVCELLTEKPDWHIKVFDEEIAEKWRREAALSDSVLDEACADYVSMFLTSRVRLLCSHKATVHP